MNTKKFVSELQVNDYVRTSRSLYKVSRVLKNDLEAVEVNDDLTLNTKSTIRVSKRSGKIHGRQAWAYVLDEDPAEFIRREQERRAKKQDERKAREDAWSEKLAAVIAANPTIETTPVLGSLVSAKFVDSKGRECMMWFVPKETELWSKETNYEVVNGIELDDMVMYSYPWSSSDQLKMHRPSNARGVSVYEAAIAAIAANGWS